MLNNQDVVLNFDGFASDRSSFCYPSADIERGILINSMRDKQTTECHVWT